MSTRQELEDAIAALEAKRAELGSAVVDTALRPLHQQLASLDAPAAPEVAAGERRVVTVLFCDVVGSTHLAERMDPEEWTGIMNAAFAQLNEAIDRYGGTVARLMGDAILAFFGAPVAHENDPERAILAGLAILENVRPLRERLKHEGSIDFNVRVGINTGLVVVGQVGSQIRGEYTAMGDAVNLAARMEQTAAPGTVQIAEDTYRAAAPLFDVEELGGISVKGKRHPVPAYRVLGRKAAPGKVRGLEARGLHSPLVGRDKELAALEQIVERVRSAKEGAIVLVLGEAGLGKSTLLEEVRRRTASADLRWLEGRTLSFGHTLSYWPFQEMLWQYAGISEEDGEETAWAKLEAGVLRLFPEQTAETLPYLAALLGLDVPEPFREKVAYLDAEALGRQVYLVTRRFFERLALTTPLILLFEDLHWMDDASARLLEHLLPLVDRVPLLIVGLSRPEGGTPGEQIARLASETYPARTTELRLKRLPPQESNRLVQNLLAVDDLPPHLRQRIVERAGGNPFFLEEIIRTLIDSGAVEQDARSGRWRATQAIETLQLPDTVQGVIIARVDRLADDVKQVLRTASVVGRSFLYRLLREVMHVDGGLDRELGTLQAIDIIREKQRQPELEYMFKHALAQEAVYESILLETRRQLHRGVAETIESFFAQRLEEFYGLLAYHYARADAAEEALAYLLKAGDRAGQVAADAEALAYYQEALKAYEQAFGARWDPLQRAALERKMGQALNRQGENGQAEQHLMLALSYLGHPLPGSRWAIRRAILSQLIQQALIRLAPGLMRKTEGADGFAGERERVQICESLALIDVDWNQERFILDILSGLNLWERIGYRPRAFAGYMGLTLALDFFGLYGLGERYLRLAVNVAQEQGHPIGLGWANYGLAMHYSWLGLPAKALACAAESARYHQEGGLLRGWGFATFMSAETLVYQGRLARAERLANEVLEFGREAGDAQLESFGLLQLGCAQRITGALPEAIAVFHRCEQLAQSVPDHISHLQAVTMIGHCYLDMGRLDEAWPPLQEAQRILHEHNVIGGRFTSIVWVALARAHVLAAECAIEDGRKVRLAEAGRACKEARKRAAHYRPFLAAAYRWQGTYEWLSGNQRQAGQWWAKSLSMAQGIGQPHEEAMTYREMGRLQGQPELVERAKELLAEIGARPDVWDADE